MSYTFSREPKRIIIGQPADIEKSAAGNAALRKLRAFLDSSEPELVQLLVNLWNTQGRAITFKELREAILAGDISQDYLEEWRQDYARFVVENLRPTWEKAMEAAIEDLHLKYPQWYFDPMADGVREWVETRGAEFVTSISENQMLGLRTVIQRAAGMNAMNVDQLARAIRPMTGLYWQQSVANLSYFRKLIESGLREQKALDLSLRYSARQIRYRGMLIARTELAFAYNRGYLEGIRQAQAAGYMGQAVKIWLTAEDERTCLYCGSLNGKTIPMDEEFPFETKLARNNPEIRLTPPAHPNCRCSYMVKEIAPPQKK